MVCFVVLRNVFMGEVLFEWRFEREKMFVGGFVGRVGRE